MDTKIVETAIARTIKVLKDVQEPWKSLAFPVVLGRTLQGGFEVPQEPAKVRAHVHRVSGQKPTRSSMLRSLITDGWLKTQRSLADIRKELKNRGLPTKSTTLPSLVLPLVLEGKLKRKLVQQGKKEVYVYLA
jgi:hypothetical protein